MDVVVTVPMRKWKEWIEEGGLPGEAVPANVGYYFSVAGVPNIAPGDRVYVVAHGKLRGYAPLVQLEEQGTRSLLWRQGGAVACTIDQPIHGFRGFRYRWWPREDERPFPEWRTAGVQ